MEQGNLLNKFAEDDSQRTAFYNTIFFVLLAVCFGGLYAVYQMLHLFLTPILFGTLFGTVLFPVKRSFSSVLNDWLNSLDEEDTPLLVGCILLPVQFLNKTSNLLFNGLYSKNGLYYIGAYILLKILGYDGTLIVLLSFFGRIYRTADLILDFLTQLWVLPLISFYAVAYISWIYIQDHEELRQKKKFARALSLPIWIIALAFASSYCGFLHVFVFTASAVSIGLIASGLLGNFGLENVNNDKSSFNDSIETNDNKEEESLTKEPKNEEEVTEKILPKIQNLEQAITSDRILRIVGSLFLLLWITKHDVILIIAMVLLLYGFILNLAEKLQLWDGIKGTIQNSAVVKDQGSKITNIIVPGFLRQFVYILFNSDRYLIGSLKRNVDLIASISVMIFLSFGALFFLLFTILQLQSETIHLGTLASNVISSNPEWLKTAMNYTGEKFNEQAINNYSEQAYKQSREWLAYNIRSLADPKDKVRADQLEEQAKILVDNLYHLYEERMISLPATENSTAIVNRGDWLTQLLSTTNVESLKNEFTLVIKENIETILTIAQSLWKILAANVSVISTVVFSIAGLLFGFGFELLNFLLEIVVFLLITYYLLANSGEQFLPLQWISDIAPSMQPKNSHIHVSGAIETAISSVFILSAKMSIFYFLYTYFVCSIFGLNVVFIPSLLASVLASIPVAPPYSVAVFGVIELYLVRGETAAAVVFVLASMSPIFFADAAFYSEIKHCHPYLIGLSVVGGIYAFGIQGAMIGPIVLCILIVLFNVYAEFVKHR